MPALQHGSNFFFSSSSSSMNMLVDVAQPSRLASTMRQLAPRDRFSRTAAATTADGGTSGQHQPGGGGIQQRQLGRTGLMVPSICFGTMLFGESQDYPTACQLLDTCMDAGVNFFDTAEMYPVPQRAETQGLSEEYLGRWLQGRSRDKVLIASKVAGPSGQMTWIRGGPHKLDAANIQEALDDSLRRLQTDYIDLYQLHWPDRYVPMFGDLDYDTSCAYPAVPLEDQLEELSRAVTAGKVRHIGMSNETPWGLMKAISLAERSGSSLPRVASVQNAYSAAESTASGAYTFEVAACSLTCRTFDIALAEVCHLEGISLLAYSPLAMGLLTGKYLASDGGPPGARLNKYKGRYAEAESRYGPKPNVGEAVAAYAGLAQQYGLTPTAMALRYVMSHPLVASAVIGASSIQQLQELLTAAGVGPLENEELLKDIDSIHQQYPNPTP